jgi:hypothetical protein
VVEGGTAIVCFVGKHESNLRCHRRRKACSRSSNSSLGDANLSLWRRIINLFDVGAGCNKMNC